MKKKLIITLSILIILTLSIILFKDNKTYTEIDGIKYAITVNGTSANAFPSGNYKVDVVCSNSRAYYDKQTSKVIVEDITGTVICNVDFTSITNSDYLNQYVIGLDNSIQGDGKLVHEIGSSINGSIIDVIKSFGSAPIYFYSTSYHNTNQNEIGDYWSYDNNTGTFTSDPTKFTYTGNTNYYHAYFKVPENGYYRVCYTINKASLSYDQLTITKYNSVLRNDTYFTSVPSSTSSQNNNCYSLDYLSTNDYINISEYAYNGTSAPTMSFRIEKLGSTPVDTGYRYEGANPNNYVWFNNELWRIIGVFGEERHGVANTNLVKIIRESPMGGAAWSNNSKTNDWVNSGINLLLNGAYYNATTDSTNCYQFGYYYDSYYHNSYQFARQKTCDYRATGIQENYRNMIENVTWYLGGGGANGRTNYRADNLFKYEKNYSYSGNSLSTTGKIGLMYPSDYAYAILSNDFDRSLPYGNCDLCSTKNWLSGNGYEMTISQYTSNRELVFFTYNNGVGGGMYAYSDAVYRPVLYLNSDVYRVSGTGTLLDPYIIGM